MKNLSAVLFVASLALVLSSPASSLVIDDFESGPFSVADTSGAPTSVTDEQSGLPGSSVIGGVREVVITATTGDANADLTTTAGSDSLQFFASENASLNLYYDGTASSSVRALGLDLSSFDALRLRTTLSGSASLRAYLYDSNGFEFKNIFVVPSGSAILDFSLADFSQIDLTDIQQIRFTGNITGGSLLKIKDVNAIVVPEPGTALLLGIGLTGLALRRRR